MLLKCRFTRPGTEAVSKKIVHYRRQIQRITEEFLKLLESITAKLFTESVNFFFNFNLYKTAQSHVTLEETFHFTDTILALN
jgi:hypothetical protein